MDKCETWRSDWIMDGMYLFVCLRLHIPVNNVILGRRPGFNQYMKVRLDNGLV